MKMANCSPSSTKCSNIGLSSGAIAEANARISFTTELNLLREWANVVCLFPTLFKMQEQVPVPGPRWEEIPQILQMCP